MTVSQVGSVIMVTNEAPVTISSISAATDGFTVTTATPHGYSNGEFVTIKGTTDYNWSFQINGVTTNTFDCTKQRFEFTTSQTGTCERGEIDISGLIGLSGVTTLTNAGMTIVDIGSNQLFVEGCLRIDPRNYILMSGVGPGAVVVQNGGELFLGKVLWARGYQYSNPLTAYINTGTPTQFYYPSNITATPEGALCVMDSSSLIVIEDASVQLTTFGSGTAGNGLQFVNDARVFIRNGRVASRGYPLSFSGIRSSNLDIEGFEFVNSTLIWGSEVVGNEPKGFTLRSSADGVFGYDGQYTWRNLEVANKGNGADILLWTDFPVSSLVHQKALNNDTGNNIKLKGATTTADSRNKGYATVAKEIIVETIDSTGADIDDANIYVRDYDNGQRKNLNGIDDTADKEYSDRTVAGETATLEVVTAIVNVASTTSTPPSSTDKIGNTTANTSDYRVDFRGKSDTTLEPSDTNQAAFDETAKFDILAVKYGQVLARTVALLAGHDADRITISMLVDSYVTLSKTAATALTGITINDATNTITVTESHTSSEIYDFVKAHEDNTPSAVFDNGFTSIMTTGDGVNHSLIYDLVIDGSGVVVTGTGVLDLGTKTLTESNGGAYDGTFSDSTGLNVKISAPNLIDGTRWELYNLTDSTQIVNEVISGGNGGSARVVYTDDKSIQLKAAYVSGVDARKFILSTGTLVSTGLTFNDAQEDDTIYKSISIDGSTATEFTPDVGNIEVDISDSDNTTTVQRFYAWFQYYISTQLGIEGYENYMKDSSDENNLVMGVPFTVENTKSTALYITGGVLTRADGSSWVNDAGGTIVVVPDRVYQAPPGQIGSSVWDYLESETTTAGSMKEVASDTRDHARAANTQTKKL